MATVVRMPSVLAGATEAAIAKWLVTAGDAVSAGTPVAEIETEKALVEYAAEEAGTVGRLVLAEGDSGQVGDPILVLVSAGETDADIDAALRAPSAMPAMPATPDAAVPPVVQGPNGHLPGNDSEDSRGAASASERRVFASPLVRKIAVQQGIDLAAVAGTGPNGRITRRDLERLAATRPAQPPAAPAVPARSPGPAPAPAHAAADAAQSAASVSQGNPLTGIAAQETAGGRRIPHTPMRRAIARRLTESAATTPHFTMVTECAVDELLALRQRVNATAAAKVSVNDFVIMAAAGAFADVPEANVTWSDEGLIAYDNVDISIAVATDGGLVTPVLRDVGAKRLTQVAREARDLAQRARDRRLLQREIEGGVLSVSNLGMYGTLEFSAIINPPQSAILAVGAARPQPVVADGAVSVATAMRCTLSVDHRAIDGALAARWLAAFTARMESPLTAIA
jgi:pyruvate dehydrogenase E2 component (dihydrolipoamide acetyltransferase)